MNCNILLLQSSTLTSIFENSIAFIFIALLVSTWSFIKSIIQVLATSANTVLWLLLQCRGVAIFSLS